MFFPKAYKLLYFIVKYFKKNFGRMPKRTELIKLMYLTDLDYYKKCGEKYSEFNYIFYQRGPWTKQFHQLLDYMKDEEIFETERSSGDGKAFFSYRLTTKTPRHDIELDNDVVSILENNFFIYKDSDLKQILDVVYKEEPMVSTPRNAEIDFSRVPLNAREKRLQYTQRRRKQLERLKKTENRMGKDDIDLLLEFKPFRDRANQLI